MALILALGATQGCSSASKKPVKAAAKNSGKAETISGDSSDIPVAQEPDSPSASTDSDSSPSEATSKVQDATPVGEISDSMYKKFSDARKGGNFKAAQEAAGEILARNPGDVRTLNGLSSLAIQQGKYDFAKMLISKVLSKEPGNSTAHNNLGVVFLKTDNLRLALVEFKKAIDSDSHNRFARANLGSIYLQYRNYAAATEELDAAVNSGDKSPETLSNLAFALSLSGQAERAVQLYEEALEKAPSNNLVRLNYAACLVERAAQPKKALNVLNKLKFSVNDPVILEKVNQLAKKAEQAANGSTEKGASQGL